MDLDLASVGRPLMYLYGSNTLVILLSKTPTCQLPILLHLTQLQTLLLLLAYGQGLGCECKLVGVARGAPLSLQSRFFLPCLHLVGGGGLSNVAAAPDEEGYASTAVVRDPDDYDLLRYSSSPRSPTGQTGQEDDDEESESWTVQEPQSVRKRREEDENAVKDFGGDLAVACKDNKQGLK